jgi:hypothetical protein
MLASDHSPWLMVPGHFHFQCPGCNGTLRLGYPEKVRIFEAHKHLAG